MVEHVNFKGDEEPEVGLCKNLEPDTSDKQVNWSSRESIGWVFPRVFYPSTHHSEKLQGPCRV